MKSYLLAYTLRTTSADRLGMTRTSDRDYYDVFSETNEDGNSPKKQAKQRLQELQEIHDGSDADTELYSWNIAKITETSEHYE